MYEEMIIYNQVRVCTTSKTRFYWNNGDALSVPLLVSGTPRSR